MYLRIQRGNVLRCGVGRQRVITIAANAGFCKYRAACYQLLVSAGNGAAADGVAPVLGIVRAGVHADVPGITFRFGIVYRL